MVVDVGPGPVVDQSALLAVLEDGHVRDAWRGVTDPSRSPTGTRSGGTRAVS